MDGITLNSSTKMDFTTIFVKLLLDENFKKYGIALDVITTMRFTATLKRLLFQEWIKKIVQHWELVKKLFYSWFHKPAIMLKQ